MPVLTQLKLNIGTEQNPNMVLHDLHDIRISSTDVNTVTRLLGCDAGVNSIAPLTLANAASLLGVGTSNILRRELGVNQVWDTGLKVGASHGATILALISYQWDAGDATASAIKGIRLGYINSGFMQIESVKVIGDNSGIRSETYSVTNNNTLEIKAGSGATLQILLLTNY